MLTPGVIAVAVFHHHIGRGLVDIVVCALVSAASYGLAAVLQHEAAIREPPGLSMRAGLLIRLAKRPRWLLGNILDGVGYIFQFLALRRGSLILVEPILVASLVLALPVSSAVDHKRIAPVGWAATGAVGIGLLLFLEVAHAGLGHPDASPLAWLVLSVVAVLVCGGAALVARHVSRSWSSTVLALGAGAGYGYVAAVTERAGHLLGRGFGHLLFSWVPIALIAAGIGAALLTQSAFHAGALRRSLPTLTVVQPIVAGAIGIGLFGEHINARGAAPLFEALGLALVVAGVFFLARSSLSETDRAERVIDRTPVA